MIKRILVVLCLGIIFLAPLSAFGNERWLSTSFAADYHYGSALPVDTSLGLDISYFLFSPFHGSGFVTKVSTTFSNSIARMAFYLGPAYRSVLAGGVEGYISFGPSFTDIENQVPGGSEEMQLGLGLDVGSRFRFSSAGSLDMALVVGIFADVSLLHIVDGEYLRGWTGNVVPYVGFSFSSIVQYGFPSYTIY